MKYRTGPAIIPRYPDGSIHIPKIEDIKEDLNNSIEINKKELINKINEIDDDKKSIYEINEMIFEIKWIKKNHTLKKQIEKIRIIHSKK